MEPFQILSSIRQLVSPAVCLLLPKHQEVYLTYEDDATNSSQLHSLVMIFVLSFQMVEHIIQICDDILVICSLSSWTVHCISKPKTCGLMLVFIN